MCKHTIVNACYISRDMGVAKVLDKVTFMVTQGHWQWCHSIGHIDFLVMYHCKYVSILHHFRNIIRCNFRNLKRFTFSGYSVMHVLVILSVIWHTIDAPQKYNVKSCSKCSADSWYVVNLWAGSWTNQTVYKECLIGPRNSLPLQASGSGGQIFIGIRDRLQQNNRINVTSDWLTAE